MNVRLSPPILHLLSLYSLAEICEMWKRGSGILSLSTPLAFAALLLRTRGKRPLFSCDLLEPQSFEVSGEGRDYGPPLLFYLPLPFSFFYFPASKEEAISKRFVTLFFFSVRIKFSNSPTSEKGCKGV